MQGGAAGAGGGAATEAEPAAERQPDAVPLPGSGRLPLVGYGTYKVDSVEPIRCRVVELLDANLYTCWYQGEPIRLPCARQEPMSYRRL